MSSTYIHTYVQYNYNNYNIHYGIVACVSKSFPRQHVELRNELGADTILTDWTPPEVWKINYITMYKYNYIYNGSIHVHVQEIVIAELCSYKKGRNRIRPAVGLHLFSTLTAIL